MNDEAQRAVNIATLARRALVIDFDQCRNGTVCQM
jgi:hypothetical protein